MQTIKGNQPFVFNLCKCMRRPLTVTGKGAGLVDGLKCNTLNMGDWNLVVTVPQRFGSLYKVDVRNGLPKCLLEPHKGIGERRPFQCSSALPLFGWRLQWASRWRVHPQWCHASPRSSTPRHVPPQPQARPRKAPLDSPLCHRVRHQVQDEAKRCWKLTVPSVA